MIDYIKYTLDGKTYSLINNNDGTWSNEASAPLVIGNYTLVFEISENGVISYVDSTDPKYSLYLEIVERTEDIIDLKKYLPTFLQNIVEFNMIFDAENIQLSSLYSNIEKVKNDQYITTASNDAILRFEKFLNIKGIGTLEQRKSFLIALLQKGNKLNENTIKSIANTITGSDCIVKFFGADEAGNPDSGYGLIRVQVLSPENNKDYRYDDILRTLKPLIPAHLKLVVIKYFALWENISTNFLDWSAVAAMNDWAAVKNYIPPQ